MFIIVVQQLAVAHSLNTNIFVPGSTVLAAAVLQVLVLPLFLVGGRLNEGQRAEEELH